MSTIMCPIFELRHTQFDWPLGGNCIIITTTFTLLYYYILLYYILSLCITLQADAMYRPLLAIEYSS